MIRDLINTGSNGDRAAGVSRETPVHWLSLHQVRDNPYQPRQHYDAEHILNLALSIKQLKRELPATKGLQQLPLARLGLVAPDGSFDAAARTLYSEPLGLRKLAGNYNAAAQLMFGHSRLRAWRVLRWGLGILLSKSAGGLRELGIDIELPDSYNQEFETRYAELMEPDKDYGELPLALGFALDFDMWRHAITENSQRKNINAIEEAQTMARAQAEFGLTDEQAGAPFGYARSTAANKMRLLKLPEGIQHDIATGVLTERHGRELLRLAEHKEQMIDAYTKARKQGKTVAQLAQDVNWRAEALHKEHEKQRQLAVARAILEAGWTPPGSTEPLPADRICNIESGYLMTFFDPNEGQSRGLLDQRLCGSHCKCCVLAYDEWGSHVGQMLCPDAERAPRIGLACAGDYEVRKAKRLELEKIGASELSAAEQAKAEAEARRQAQLAELQSERRQHWEQALATMDVAMLWQDMRLWRQLARIASYSWTHLVGKGVTIAEFQQALLEELYKNTERWDKDLGGYVPDAGELDQLIAALTGWSDE